MNQEFILGKHNIERVREDPGALEEVLRSQRARGFGPPQKLRQHAREVRKRGDGRRPGKHRGKSRPGASPRATHWLWRTVMALAKFTGAVVLGILAGAWWAERDKKNKGCSTGGIFW